MGKEFLVVTPKGERLIASKFGIPYGLFLAIYAKYWFVPLIVNVALQVLFGWYVFILAALVNVAIAAWSDKHFKV